MTFLVGGGGEVGSANGVMYDYYLTDVCMDLKMRLLTGLLKKVAKTKRPCPQPGLKPRPWK